MELVFASPVGLSQHLLSSGEVADDVIGSVVDQHLQWIHTGFNTMSLEKSHLYIPSLSGHFSTVNYSLQLLTFLLVLDTYH